MAKANVEPTAPVCSCWAVCVDTEARRCEVSKWIVVNGEWEGRADAVARESGDGLNAPALLESLRAQKFDEAIFPVASFMDIEDMFTVRTVVSTAVTLDAPGCRPTVADVIAASPGGVDSAVLSSDPAVAQLQDPAHTNEGVSAPTPPPCAEKPIAESDVTSPVRVEPDLTSCSVMYYMDAHGLHTSAAEALRARLPSDSGDAGDSPRGAGCVGNATVANDGEANTCMDGLEPAAAITSAVATPPGCELGSDPGELSASIHVGDHTSSPRLSNPSVCAEHKLCE
jgi:hypothetical protein